MIANDAGRTRGQHMTVFLVRAVVFRGAWGEDAEKIQLMFIYVPREHVLQGGNYRTIFGCEFCKIREIEICRGRQGTFQECRGLSGKVCLSFCVCCGFIVVLCLSWFLSRVLFVAVCFTACLKEVIKIRR